MLKRGSGLRYAVVAVVACSLVLGGCGGGASDDELAQARAEGAQEAREQDKVERLEEQVKQLQRQNRRQMDRHANRGGGGSGGSSGSPGGGVAPGGPSTVCQDTVSVGPNTSCSFAMNVAGEYGSNPGATSIRAYSPATERFYVMTCSIWSGGGTVCTGGNGATVYIR